MEALEVLRIETYAALKGFDFEMNHSRLVCRNTCQTFIILDKPLELAPHVDTAEEPFERCQLRSWQALGVRGGGAQYVEGLVGYQRRDCAGPRPLW